MAVIDGPVLTLDEVAARVKLSRRTVEREVKAGHIRVLRIGPAKRRVVVTEAEVRAYLAAAHRAA